MTKMKNKKYSIGIVGRNFGSIVSKEIAKHHEIKWLVGAADNFNDLAYVDIAYIATPTEFHFEHAKFFLRNSSAVIVEKPPSFSSQVLEELLVLAEDHGTFIYFSDVFNFRSDVVEKLKCATSVSWLKTGSSDDWIGSRLAYHYLYLLADYLSEDTSLKVFECTKDALHFRALIGDREVEFEFSQNATINQHKIDEFMVPSGVEGSIRMMLDPLHLTASNINKNNKKTMNALKFFGALRKHMPAVNVIGGGIFGTQTAIALSKSGINVTLCEKNQKLMSESSAINQYRVHLGYHYPRSKETVLECQKSISQFVGTFGSALVKDNEAHYAIATSGSKVTAERYEAFLEEMRLQYQEVQKLKNCDLTVKVEERLYSPSILRELIIDRLRCLDVRIKLEEYVEPSDPRLNEELTIFATYSNSGNFDDFDYQHEICEKPVVRLPKKYKGKGYVIMDGPFMCVDPFEDSDLHVMGHVAHAIHSTNIGSTPIIPTEYKKILNKGIIDTKDINGITKFHHFREACKEFFDFGDDIQHIGSMFTVRSVLPYRDHDDARPTELRWINNQNLIIFSGKVVTCVRVARKATELTWSALSKEAALLKS